MVNGEDEKVMLRARLKLVFFFFFLMIKEAVMLPPYFY